MEKRGEGLSSAYLIAIILGVVGFAIVLAFLVQLKTGGYSEGEVCKLSVLARATAAEAKQGVQGFIPLQCTTQKICLVTSSNEECNQFQGEKNVNVILLPKSTVGDVAQEEQQARVIEKYMAEAMYSCWDIMGQGKLDLFTGLEESIGANWGVKDSNCVICSRVALSTKIDQGVLNRVDVNAYMDNNVVPGTSVTYSQAMSNDGITNTYTSFKAGSVQENSGLVLNPASDREIVFIFMQMKSEKISDVLKNQLDIAGVTTGAAFMISPSAAIGAARFVFNPTGLISTVTVGVLVAGYGAGTTYLNQMSAVGYCGKFTSSKDQAREGCSIVQAFPYSTDNINRLCKHIEGNV